MSLKVIIVFLYFIYGTLGDVPPCFTNGTSWHNNGDTNVMTNVADAYDCQESCATSNCSGFTYYSHHSQHFPLTCLLFDSLTTEEACEDCISGPASCTCSASYSCDITADNTIDVFSSIQSESECQNICFNTVGCNFYTYFNEQNIMEGLCYIFSSCSQIDETCTGCFTGPPVCKPSTTTADPMTTTSGNLCESDNYKILDDPTRNATYSGHDGYCDSMYLYTSRDWQGPGWYRMSEKDGAHMPEFPPAASSSCGTEWPGWMNGQHPQVLQEEVERQVCFNNDEGYPCDTFAVDISVINCGSFYLYKLPNTPTCRLRYCAV